MDNEIREHLKAYCEKEGWSTNDETLFELLFDAPNLERKEVGQHRWWNEFRYVVEINGMLIGYIYAEANRDESMADLGYDFDPSTICKMTQVEKTIITYEPV
jgi:hypothetical protein